MKIAITGATGHLGKLVAERLRDRSPRLIARDPAKAPDGFEAVAADYAERASYERALVGIDTLLLISAGEAPDPVGYHRNAVEAARAAGVRHIVYTSTFGASPQAVFSISAAHAQTEAMIKESGLAYTILRDNYYTELVLSFVGDDGVIRGPAGQGQVAPVARADVADVAAAVLRTPEQHAELTYDLTGPDAMTLGEVAERISAATGRRVSYHEESPEEAYDSRRSAAPDDKALEAWVSTYRAVAAGEFGGVSTAVADVTGRPPRSLEDVIAEAE